MRIAIIIGISEYDDKQNNLPGCYKDAEIVKGIIDKTGKFDSVLYINDKLSSAVVKERITDFISENKKNQIQELFFYFTGHGEFFNNEFYYILSDFSKSKRKQTSLQNEEIDNLIKTLNPELVVKIIDACQSGKTYIKEKSVVQKYFKLTQGNFNNCYFLNSSLKDQSSMQTDLISDFTLSFINAVKEHKSKEIRYKDIIDFISDEFAENEIQTPFFVIQADYTEKFCELNDTLRKYLDGLDTRTLDNSSEGLKEISLIEKIKKNASQYLTKEKALKVIEDLKKEIEKIECDKELKEVYVLDKIISEDYSGILKQNAIGKWLDENSHEFFATSLHKQVRKDRHLPYTNLLSSPNLFGIEKEVDFEYVRDGFDLEIEVPYKSIIFNLNSKYPNVESYTARVIYFISQRQIRFFYFITNFITKNWDERELNEEIEWFFTEHPISKKEEVNKGINKIYMTLEKTVRRDLEEKFESSEKPQDKQEE